MYLFTTLDPRNIPEAIKANNNVFLNQVYGIEVTIPESAERCYHNLDPQHTDGDANRTAIEEALTAELPRKGSTLATVRADLDSLGAMAIFKLRAEGKNFESAMSRITMIAEADKFAHGGYPGPKSLPTRSNPWSENSATAESSHPLAGIAKAIADFKIPMADRVSTMEQWLLTGNEPAQYRAQAEKERLEMITALETGQIKFETRFNNRIAVVESTHSAAISIGYSLAAVVVAYNPIFKQGSSEPYKKFTICTFEAKFADIKSALAELATLETGWGGSPTIGGSPQGISSILTINQVVEIVAKHLC